jgi:hypothetical protein
MQKMNQQDEAQRLEPIVSVSMKVLCKAPAGHKTADNQVTLAPFDLEVGWALMA